VSLRERFRAFLHPDLLADRHATVILARLAELEARELHHALTIKESADQIARHLKRVSAIEQRSEAREENGNGRSNDLTRRLLDIKLRQGGS
jgi:hypothetical protein